MSAPINWDEMSAEYGSTRAAVRSGVKPSKPLEAPREAIDRMATLAPEDVESLIAILRDDNRKWFVAALVGYSKSLPDAMFSPLLDAGIDEVNPSFNRSFIAPCLVSFGARRVNTYLLDAVESGTDDRKAGAVNALYQAYSSELPDDVRERKRKMFLKTFVTNSNLDVRRSLIAHLDLNEDAYDVSFRHFVPRAIDIARQSEDWYIRHRVEVQLGNVRTLPCLPHRQRP